MPVIFQMVTIPSQDTNYLTYEVTVTDGQDQVVTEDDLLRELKDSIPVRKGIIEIKHTRPYIWIVTSNK